MPETNDNSGPDLAPDPDQADPDALLVARAQEELPYRTAAFEALMGRHQSLLYNVCLRILRSPHDAEDVAQDVMVKVFMSLPRFERRSKFKTWLVRIARNTCFSLIAKRQRRDEHTGEDIEIPVDAHTGTQNAILVDQLLDGLEPADREVLVLRYIADLSLQEIAEVCEIGLSAAKMRLYRATDKLREAASDEDDEPA